MFNIPLLNQTVPIDLEGNLLSGQELSIVGQYISENGFEGEQPLANVLSYIDVQFTANVESELAGKIKGISIEKIFFVIFSASLAFLE